MFLVGGRFCCGAAGAGGGAFKDDPSVRGSLTPPLVGLQKCKGPPFWNSDREPWGSSLRFYTMVDHYQGLYYCTVHFQRGGRQLNFTRAVNVTAISESSRRRRTRPHAHTCPGNHFLSPQIPPACPKPP